MTYTKDNPNKFFLNDKNIAQDLKYGDIQLNAIPSLDLVSSLYNQLSAEDKRQNDYIVSVETSAYAISSNIDSRLIQLSNALSTYSNSLCTAISNQVDNNRHADKIELSNTLSNYANDKILDLSTSISNQVNSEFVHKIGDAITGSLSIANQLTVDGNVTLKNNIEIRNNLIQGKDTYIHNSVDRGIAIGISALANKNDAFVWNGNDNISQYESQEAGSFSINPRSGVNGFYIGTQNISSIIKNDVALTANNLSTYSNGISSELCTTIDTRRAEDKTELSATLSSYANYLCAVVSNDVDSRRTEDKAELSNVLSTYANSLCTEISNQIVDSRFAYCTSDTVKFWYQSSTDVHALWFELSGINDSKVQLSVDTTAFIKDRILKKAEVCYNEETPPVLVLRLYWNNTESSVGEYTDIKIQDLAKIYKAGKGIQITEDLSISVVDYDGITFCLNQTSSNVDTLSNITIPSYNRRVTSLEEYTKKLSSTYTDGGIIATLSIDLHNLSDHISSDVNALSTTTINIISVNLDSALEHNTRLQAYADQLSGASGWIGDIPYLSNVLSVTRDEIRGCANFCGQVSMNKYQPDWVRDGDTHISAFFKYAINRGALNSVKNGNIYEIVFQEHPDITPVGRFVMSDPLYAADQYFDTADGLRLAHECFIIAYSNDDTTDIPLEKLDANTVRIIAGEWYVPYQLSVINNLNEIWRNGNNKLTSSVEVSVYAYHSEPTISVITGHAISGNNDIGGSNHFLYGQNIFDGYNKIEELSAFSLSVEKLSASDVAINYLSANLISTDKLSAYDADVYDLSVGSNAKITGNLTVDNKLIANTELSIALSTNIANGLYVKDSTTLNSTAYVNSNLSVNNALTATSTQTDVVKLSAGQLTANFANVYDSSENKDKYSTLNAFETSVELSTQNLCAYVRQIQNNVNEIYSNVSSIALTSQLSDVISAVVEIAHKLSNIINVQY